MSKVIFLICCLVIMARMCHSGSSSGSKSGSASKSESGSASKSGSGSDSSKKKMSGLENRVKELEDMTEDISNYMMEKVKVSEGVKGDTAVLQKELEAAIASLEELQSQIDGNTACCEKALATPPPTTTTTTVEPATPDPRCGSPIKEDQYCWSSDDYRYFYNENAGHCALDCPDYTLEGFDTAEECNAACQV